MKMFLNYWRRAKIVLVCLFLFSAMAEAQSSSKSLLINHGGSSCGSINAEDHFFAGALTPTPSLALACTETLPYYAVYTAYNPADHKIYFADVSTTDTTRVYTLDYGLPGNLSCPAFGEPTYVYGFTLNQLCFDNHGNNYGINNFDPVAGTASLMQVDIATGAEKPGTKRTIQFPVNNVPNSLGNGDIVILPNGRMFASFGNAPSYLYELPDPNGSGTIEAVLLTALPRPCFSIAFIDGNLAIAGSDNEGCYYFIWNINSLSLSPAFQFPLDKSSADMSNLTAAVGASKKVVGVNILNSNTATVVYQIVIKNKGNILLNNVQVTDDAESVFGSGNVSSVKTSFVSNPAGLQLNKNYNGTIDKNLLAPQQVLNNFPAAIDSIIINLEVTATNLKKGIYYSSAVVSGNIGSGSSIINVSDSTNDGGAERIDLNGNDVSDDAGENTPTPFYFSIDLPARGIELKGSNSGSLTKLFWTMPAGETYRRFEVERSSDGNSFKIVGSVLGQENKASFTDTIIASQQGRYYRIKAIAADNTFVYSNTLYLSSRMFTQLNAFPNPFRDAITVQFQSDRKTNVLIQIRDIAGKLLAKKIVPVEKGVNCLTLAESELFQPGVYFLELLCYGKRDFIKLVKQ